MRVLRIYHGGRDVAHRARERALVAYGVDVHLVVPAAWSGPQHTVAEERIDIRQLPVVRAGDVNRHRYADVEELRGILGDTAPDLVDLHEEPFSAVTRQLLQAIPESTPVVCYTAQNVDKRYPPPFCWWEGSAFRRLSALYPCTRQAASVARGKGFGGLIDVIPLGYDDTRIKPGTQQHADDEFVLGLVGRMVPEKGVTDAVDVLHAVSRVRRAKLVLVGAGPALAAATSRAGTLGVEDAVEVIPWADAETLAKLYSRMHVVLVPSRRTATWVEQFGRVIVEGQAAGAVIAGYRSGSIPEVAGDTAALAVEGDVAGLQAAVVSLADDAVAWQTLRGAGISAAKERTWKVVAARQAALYEGVLNSAAAAERRLSRPTRPTRASARAEWGPTADLLGGERPFALPVLRDHPRLGQALGASVDAVVTPARRLRPWRPTSVR